MDQNKQCHRVLGGGSPFTEQSNVSPTTVHLIVNQIPGTNQKYAEAECQESQSPGMFI